MENITVNTGKTKKRMTKWASVGIASLILVFSLVTRVGTGEIGVVTRFGKVTGRELGEGIHLKLPFDRVNKYDVKIQKEETEVAAASKDLQDVFSTLVVNYRVDSSGVSRLHQNIGKEYRSRVIDPALQETFKAVSAQFTAAELITKRTEVKDLAFKLLTKRLKPYWIELTDLSITNFRFSEAFSKAIENKQVAQQNAERARFNLEASRLDAQAQEVQAKTLSKLFIQKLFLEKWDGRLPLVTGSGNILDVSSLIGEQQ